MARARTQGWLAQHLPSAIGPLVEQVGHLLEAQPIPAPGIREGDGRFKVSTVVEAAVMKMERDLRKNVSLPSPQAWDDMDTEYENIRRASNEAAPAVLNTSLSEAVDDALAKIAAWMTANGVQEDKAYFGEAVNRRRLVVYALLHTINTSKGTG